MSAKIILNSEQKNQIIKLYKEKPSITKVCRELNLRHPIVKGFLSESEVKIRPYKNLTEEDEQKIVKLYSSGMFINQVAEKFGVSSDTVTRKLMKHGIKIRNNYRLRPTKRNLENKDFEGLSQEQINEMITLYKSGVSAIKISNTFGITNTTVCRLLRKQGIERNYYSNLNPENEKELLKLYQEGKPVIRLADQFHTSPKTIRNLLIKNGIKPRGANDYERKRNKFTIETEKEITNEYKNGTSSSKLAEKYKASSTGILKIVKRNTLTLELKDIPDKNINPLPKLEFRHEPVKYSEPTKPILYGQNQKFEEFILTDPVLQEFFDRHKINIHRNIWQITYRGIPREFLEDYLLYIKELLEKHKFITNYASAYMTAVLKENNIVSFLQKIEGRLRNKQKDPVTKSDDISKARLFLQNNMNIFYELIDNYHDDISIELLLKHLKPEELINSDFIIKALLPDIYLYFDT